MNILGYIEKYLKIIKSHENVKKNSFKIKIIICKV